MEGGGGGPGSQLSRLWGVDPCRERDMQGQEPPSWGGASEKAGPPVSICGGRSLWGRVPAVLGGSAQLPVPGVPALATRGQALGWAMRVGQPGQRPRTQG